MSDRDIKQTAGLIADGLRREWGDEPDDSRRPALTATTLRVANGVAGTKSCSEQLLNRPFSHLMDWDLVFFGEGRAEVRVRICPTFIQTNGGLARGIVEYVADTAMSLAGSRGRAKAAVVVDLRLAYYRPASGQWLVARAEAEGEPAGASSVVSCEMSVVSAAEEYVCAFAQGFVARPVTAAEGRTSCSVAI